MPGQHRALDWLARRHAGESVGLIAHRAGVSESVVVTATKAYGPFPRPTQLLGRRRLDDAELSERTRRWIEARRHGQTSTAIARVEGVSHQRVSQLTRDHGPFPSVDVVEQLVADRQAGRTVAAIAEERGVRAAVGRRATKPHGPFPGPGGRLPEGVVGVNGVARMARVSCPTVLRWQRSGRLPGPDFTTANGRALWFPVTITRWLDSATCLEVCPICGARCVSLAHHRSAVHGA